MKKKLLTTFAILIILLMSAAFVSAKEVTDVSDTLIKVRNYELNRVTKPSYGSASGDWLVLALARSGYDNCDYYGYYLANVYLELERNHGVLSSSMGTSYARLVLSLTALGVDVTDVKGYNLLTYLADYNFIIKQGISGPIWALIAINSGDYDLPSVQNRGTSCTRELLIKYILEHEIDGGGWGLRSTADADITAMAIQALSPYYEKDTQITGAVKRGLEKLKTMQNSNGTYSSYGIENCESTAQVLLALSALGFQGDNLFVKNGSSVLNGLLSFLDGSGGFCHTKDGNVNDIATYQGFCGLVAYDRAIKGKHFLYDMSDNGGFDIAKILQRADEYYTKLSKNQQDNGLNKTDKNYPNINENKKNDRTKGDPEKFYKNKGNIWQNAVSVKSSDKADNKKPADAKKKSDDNTAYLLITKEQFQSIIGKNKNISVKGNTDSYSYTVIFNGEYIENPTDFNGKMIMSSPYDDTVARLASYPYMVFSFLEKGAFPGKAGVRLNTSLPDGEYLLFYYNNKNEKAEFCQYVTVTEGKAEFFVTKGGTYYISTESFVTVSDDGSIDKNLSKKMNKYLLFILVFVVAAVLVYVFWRNRKK